MSELELQDAILRQSLQLLRLTAGEQAQVDTILRQMEADLRTLLASEDLSAAGKAQVKALIDQADEIITAGYGTAASSTDTRALALIVAQQTADFIGEVIPREILSATPERLASLTTDVLIDGAASSAWWSRQSEDLAFRFAAQVRQGMAANETQEQIVSRIVGKSGEPGIMETARRNARALVHSSVMSAANSARLATFRKNKRLIKGVRWLATLDGATCWSGDTLVRMADGTERPISEVKEGDFVLGGVSGSPKRVFATMKSVAPSSVIIHSNGRYVGRTTEDHPILTPGGWRTAGSVALSADISKREVLCRHLEAPKCAAERAPETGAGGSGPCGLSGVEEAWRTNHADHRQGNELRDGLCDGVRANHAPQNEGTARLQHDQRRGRFDWGDADARMEREGRQAQSCACSRSSDQGGCSPDCYRLLEGPAVSGAGQCRPECQAGRIAERPGVEGLAGGEVCGNHAPEMAGPGVSGQDGKSQAAGYSDRCAETICCETLADHGIGGPFSGSSQVLGEKESISVGTITGTIERLPIEVFNLAVEEDHTFLAGGIIVHNCPRCAALDHAAWDLDGKPIEKTTVSFMAPPIHFGDRCVLTPIPKTFRDMGLDIPEPDNAGQRASSEGPVAGNTTFNAFLKRQSPAFVEQVLGKKRADLFRAGKITVKDLISGAGRELSLDELQTL